MSLSCWPTVVTLVCHPADQLQVDQDQRLPLTEAHLHLLALQDEAGGGAEVMGCAHLNKEVNILSLHHNTLVTVYRPGSTSFQYSPRSLEVTGLPTTAPASSLMVTTALATP